MSRSNLREFAGKIVEICPRYKAIVQFQLDNKTERALLWYDKLRANGQPLPEGGSIDKYVHKDDTLTFLCHPFDESGVDRCRWYITCGRLHEKKEVDLKDYKIVTHGLYNISGQIFEVAKRQGILTAIVNGKEENVLFLASKLFMSGKRVSAKANLKDFPSLDEGRSLMFDAVPSDPEMDGHCKWFATVAWRGQKPLMEYDKVRHVRNKPPDNLPPLTEIKLVTSNPHSLFVVTMGQVVKVLNAEYAIALASLKDNRWETVLFHRSTATVFNRSLADRDLKTIFAEGDMVRLVAAAAPAKMGTSWVASQVHMYVHPSFKHRFKILDKKKKMTSGPHN